MNVLGKIVAVLPEVKGQSARGEWTKKEFVIETEEQYPKKICFTLFNDKISLLDGYAAGNRVDVHFNVESREYNGKYFHNISSWKIENPAPNAGTTPPPFTSQEIPQVSPEEAKNDLPW